MCAAHTTRCTRSLAPAAHLARRRLLRTLRGSLSLQIGGVRARRQAEQVAIARATHCTQHHAHARRHQVSTRHATTQPHVSCGRGDKQRCGYTVCRVPTHTHRHDHAAGASGCAQPHVHRHAATMHVRRHNLHRRQSHKRRYAVLAPSRQLSHSIVPHQPPPIMGTPQTRHSPMSASAQPTPLPRPITAKRNASACAAHMAGALPHHSTRPTHHTLWRLGMGITMARRACPAQLHSWHGKYSHHVWPNSGRDHWACRRHKIRSGTQTRAGVPAPTQCP